MIDLRNICRSELRFELKDLRFDLVPVGVQRAAGGAQQLVGLLDDDGVPVFFGPDLENIVDVSVSDLDALGLFVGRKLMQHLYGVSLYVVSGHQEKLVKAFHYVNTPFICM